MARPTEYLNDRPRDGVLFLEHALVALGIGLLLLLVLLAAWLLTSWVFSLEVSGAAAALAPAARGVRADVRNPLLSLPGVAELQALPPESQAALRKVLKSISADARARAEKCWRTHKAPMAAYWKAVAVYANHTSRLLRGS